MRPEASVSMKRIRACQRKGLCTPFTCHPLESDCASWLEQSWKKRPSQAVLAIVPLPPYCFKRRGDNGPALEGIQILSDVTTWLRRASSRSGTDPSHWRAVPSFEDAAGASAGGHNPPSAHWPFLSGAGIEAGQFVARAVMPNVT